MKKTCIIIGASHAGGQAAISLRQAGWVDDIIVVGSEGYLPYNRPPLSKGFLSGGKSIDDILIRPAQTYETANIEIVLAQDVHIIDRKDKLLFLGEGHVIAYDKLIIATGARPRRLPIDGAEQKHVYYLRSAADVLAIKDAAKDATRAVIIGGGYIGLETAASLTKQGIKVSVLEMEPRILQRVTAPIMSDFYRRVHQEEGVEIAENCAAARIESMGASLRVHTNDQRTFDGDFVIVGIGVIPNIELADKCGLDANSGGIAVNQYCQTSDPDIYAIGDVASFAHPLYGKTMRLESVPNANDMAKTAAGHLCGKDKPYNTLPWFWSDQFDLKLQIAGLSDGYDDVILRGDPTSGRSFAAYYFKKDALIAVDAVNRPQEYMAGKRMIMGGISVDKKTLANEEIPLKTLLK